MDNLNRRNFIRNSIGVLGASVVAGSLSSCATGNNTASSTGKAKRNMALYTNEKLDKVRVGIIGLGMRGSGAVDRLSKIKDVEITALCDLRKGCVDRSQKTLERNNRPAAKAFHSSQDSWKKMLDLELDLVYIATPWDLHTVMCVDSMNSGKHVACEVPVTKTLEEAWQIVNVSEATGKHCVILENCCYDFFEMNTLNMVREGVFGELTHAEGAYIHALGPFMKSYQNNWRFKENVERNGGLYLTHGIGPIAQCLNINRGNQMTHFASMSSQEAAFSHWNEQAKAGYKYDKFRGDMNTSIVQCANGETMMLQHDVSTPRPYSRIHLLQGSKGAAQKWPATNIALDSVDHGHRWLNQDERRKLEEKYQHPLTKTMGDIAKKVGGHGGMDFIMDYRLIYCLKNGLPMDMNVYDAASWSAVSTLSEISAANNGERLEVPDFTRGQWKNTEKLDVVDVNLNKLPVVESIKQSVKQLSV